MVLELSVKDSLMVVEFSVNSVKELPTVSEEMRLTITSTNVPNRIGGVTSTGIGAVVMKTPMPEEVTPPVRMGTFLLVMVSLISQQSSETVGNSLTESSQIIGGSLEKSSENFGMGLRSIGAGIGALGLFLMAGTHLLCQQK